jgi:diacylglycerol kinase family enzyme
MKKEIDRAAETAKDNIGRDDFIFSIGGRIFVFISEFLYGFSAKVIQRGEQIEVLVSKTDDLAATGVQFRRSATTVKHKMWWKNAKVWVLLFCVIAVCFYLN